MIQSPRVVLLLLLSFENEANIEENSQEKKRISIDDFIWLLKLDLLAPEVTFSLIQIFNK